MNTQQEKGAAASSNIFSGLGLSMDHAGFCEIYCRENLPVR